MGVSIGLDVGSVSVNLVAIRPDGELVLDEYIRHNGRPAEKAAAALAAVTQKYGLAGISQVSVTGTGGMVVARHTGATFVNEIAAAAAAVARLYPHAKTIIDIGGEGSKLIFVSSDGAIRDFSMNTSCAAGTGSFLDEQAARLGYTIEEFSQAGLRSEIPPRVAGRCSVFAKSDMIHLQQLATPDYDIIAGLSYAMARNFKSNLSKGLKLEPPVVFQGGVAANASVVRAMKDVLELAEDQLIVPEHHSSMGAIGAVICAQRSGDESSFRGVEALIEHVRHARPEGRALEKLDFLPGSRERHYTGSPEGIPEDAPPVVRAYLGVDVGSISTNVVAIDEAGRLMAKSYLMTAGRPIEAVRAGLKEVWAKVGPRLDVRGVGTTGSGRYLTGDLVGADIVRNEITAQARGAAAIDPTVDTIFEIGGQDSKYISIENGVVVDFAMNYVCAAGTGSFLEEQAERLGISIKGEFADLALSCGNPVRLGERCTVFMQSDVVAQSSRGASVPQLVSGLAYSIVLNYLNRVVGHRRIGRNVFFQGGTAANGAIVAAFERVTGRPVTVPRHHDVTGAIGAALLAREHQNARGNPRSRFRGSDLAEKQYRLETFECRGCANSCEINKVIMEGEAPLFYGSRCDKYNLKDSKDLSRGLPDLFAAREKMLADDYTQGRPGHPLGTIGIPRALVQQELLPFWKAFLSRLGFQVVVSTPTNREIVRLATEHAAADVCFPAKAVIGHVMWLSGQGVRRVFVPHVATMPKEAGNQRDSWLCPYVQSTPYLLKSTLGRETQEIEFVAPVVYFDRGKANLLREMLAFARAFGVGRRDAVAALEAAIHAQRAFRNRFDEEIARVLAETPPQVRRVALIGRAYNTCDGGLNLDLPKKLLAMGVLPVPMDALLGRRTDVSADWDNMYWRNGQRILAAAEKLARDRDFDAIYVTNFGCGPDSFLTTFFGRAAGSKPVLHLEIDEHSADAGVITRIEAWLDSLANVTFSPAPAAVLFPEIAVRENRTVYIPHMCEHAHAVAAAFRSVGIPSEALAPTDPESVEIGRRYTNGKECLPAIMTTGDMLKKVFEPGFRDGESAFFMPSGTGPCRFGQYHKLHRLILRELGRTDVPVFAPVQGRNFYRDFKGISGDPTRPGWQGIVAVDLLVKALHETRPYEILRGQTDRVFQECLARVCSAIEDGGDPFDALKDAARDFRSIPVDKSHLRPLVGLVGEIYIRHNEAGNNFVIRRLEELGLEVELAGFCEWIFYTNHTRFKSSFVEKDFGDFFITTAKDTVQRIDERRLGRPFSKVIRHTIEPPTRLLLDKASPYLDERLEGGEATLSVAKAVEFFEEGASGVVNVMPFTCMPGNISAVVMRRVHEDCGLFPILNVAYDGQEDAAYQTKLEAFAQQVRQYRDAKAASGIAASRRSGAMAR